MCSPRFLTESSDALVATATSLGSSLPSAMGRWPQAPALAVQGRAEDGRPYGDRASIGPVPDQPPARFAHTFSVCPFSRGSYVFVGRAKCACRMSAASLPAKCRSFGGFGPWRRRCGGGEEECAVGAGVSRGWAAGMSRSVGWGVMCRAQSVVRVRRRCLRSGLFRSLCLA